MSNTTPTQNETGASTASKKNEKTPTYSLEAICGIKKFDEAERYYAKGHLKNSEEELTIEEWEAKFDEIGLPYGK